MRYLEKNKTPIWYSSVVGETPYIDEDGNDTGETNPTYAGAVKTKVHLYPNSGNIVTEIFGNVTNIDYIMVTNEDFQSGDMFYLNEPVDLEQYDYYITRISRSVNVNQYGLTQRI